MKSSLVQIPRWYLVVVVVLLLWNIMGVIAFFDHILISDDALNELSTVEQALYANFPLWSKIVFAIAVFSGVLGCLGLLFMQRWANIFVWISLIAVIVQNVHSLFIAGAIEVYGTQAVIMPIVLIVLGAFLVWLSNYAIRKNWLR